MVYTRLGTTVAAIALAAGSPGAFAQSEGTLLSVSIPFGFNKGRNISVVERARPDFDPIGLRVGSFEVFPALEAGAAYTTNVALSANEKSDVGILVNPRVSARSDWSRHQVQFRAGGEFERYLDTPIRNQNGWYAQSLGRLDVSDGLSLTGEAQTANLYETPFSSELDPNLGVLSSYQRTYFAARGEYQSGQSRFSLAVDDTLFNFDSIDVAGAPDIDQSDRDRNIVRITGQAEYAFTPSAAVFGRVGYEDTNYDLALLRNGQPNRDSHAWRAIAGMNLDLAGLLRGQLGVGYVVRDYSAAGYRTFRGFSVETRVEYFPSELTTFTLELARNLQDASTSGILAYYDNRAALSVDHELLRNLILRGGVEFAKQDFIDSNISNDVYRVSGGARYFVSPLIELQGTARYTTRDRGGATLGNDFDEFRFLLSVIIHP